MTSIKSNSSISMVQCSRSDQTLSHQCEFHVVVQPVKLERLKSDKTDCNINKLIEVTGSKHPVHFIRILLWILNLTGLRHYVITGLGSAHTSTSSKGHLSSRSITSNFSCSVTKLPNQELSSGRFSSVIIYYLIFISFLYVSLVLVFRPNFDSCSGPNFVLDS